MSLKAFSRLSYRRCPGFYFIDMIQIGFWILNEHKCLKELVIKRHEL